MSTLPPLRPTRTPADPTVTPGPGLARVYDPVLNGPRLPYPARELLQELLDLRLTDPPAIREFLSKSAEKLPGLTSRDRAGQALAHAGLLTPFQRDRVIAGSTFGLVLGSYRVLDRIGGGSVGAVFRGEHVMLRRRVAIKVLPIDDTIQTHMQERFQAEMRALASIDHPHVVAAYDAGVLAASGQTSLHYLVLELVPGGDLEQFVYDRGPQPVARACEWARQAAAGLQAAHDRNLVHRDLKPSNLLLTEEGRVKIVDFGLARLPTSAITAHRNLVGSVEFMSPEQSLDATAVGPAADVYGLGATLFWVLTGHLPLARCRTVMEAVKTLQTGKPRRVRDLRADVPEALDEFVARMLERDPADRPTAVEVMHGLTPFTEPDSGPSEPGKPMQTRSEALRETVRQLEGSLRARDEAVRKAQDALLFAMAKMAESHDGASVGHLRRMQEYVRVLAERLIEHPDWAVLQDSTYVAELIRCVPLHDIGKIRLPDAVLGKPGPLTSEEREQVETHPVSGAQILEALAREHGESLTFLSLARAVVRHHHERWDGTGYPDRLCGEEIPPAARLVALADVYDALRQDRPDRPGVDHAAAATVVLSDTGHFDPAVRDAFGACEKLFEEIYLTIPN
ncbi:MAG TPA: protein kinase [Gemmataceae bacterium]|nr:protein kinase [Gemmataceae bacterium]